MKTISIPRIVLKHPNKYLLRDNQYDILGCILLKLGYTIPDKTKLPSELKMEIPYFTTSIRRKIVDTDLTIRLLDLDCSPQKEAIRSANILLQPIQIQIQVVDI